MLSFGLLTQLEKEDFGRVYHKLRQIQASRIGIDPRTNLNNFYITYLKGDRTDKIIIPYSTTLYSSTQILVHGYGFILNETRKDAAEKAITRLQNLGYRL